MTMETEQRQEPAGSGAFQTYHEAVEWINGLVTFGIKPGLRRMEELMERFDRPDRRLKFIHVAGTNGKGSTCAFLSSVLHRAGYDVGTFTSPYIEKFTNRIQVNGEDIPEEAVLRLANRIKPHVDQIALTELGSPSMFEVVTTLSILYFAREAGKIPHFVVWETGLGGRLDSTNIVVPLLSVITNVGMDHTEILGNTIGEIAAEKAGIIKPGVPVVTSVEDETALGIVKEKALECRSGLYVMGSEFRYEPAAATEREQSFRFEGPFRSLDRIRIRLNGAHQLKNASLALMALELLRQYYAVIVEDEDLLSGMRETAWPGRLELLMEAPRLLIDGAHNDHAAISLASALRSTYTYDRLHFMMGMVSTKNHLGYIKHILPLVDTLIITEPDFHKKMDAPSLASVAEEAIRELNLQDRVNLIVEPRWKAALDLLLGLTKGNDLAVVSGTLYLLSDVRSWILYQSDSEKGW